MHCMGMGLAFASASIRVGSPENPISCSPNGKPSALCMGAFGIGSPGCNLAATPSTRPTFWVTKFSANVLQDARNKDALKEAGWRVAIVWECSLGARNTEQVAAALADWLKRTEPFLEIGKSMDLRDASHR